MSQFSADAEQAQACFERFVTDQSGNGHDETFHANKGIDSRLLSGDDFVNQVLRQEETEHVLKSRFEKANQPLKGQFEETDEELRAIGQSRRLSELRALLAWSVSEFSDGSLTELATVVNHDAGTLS